MTILLSSGDTRVFELCRHTLQSMGEADLKLIWGSSEHPVVADLTIWDVDERPAPVPLSGESLSQQNIFLMSRGQTTLFRDAAESAATILLKPLTEGPLRVCIEQALNRKRGTPHHLDTNAKSLLQFTLEAIVKLQEYDQGRTNFIARAVHDFRAPLTALKGYCGLLLDQQLGPLRAGEAEVLIRMRHSVERLSRMAEDMFQLAVGSRCDPKPNLQEVDVSACVHQAVHEVRPFIDAKQLQLTVETDELSRPARVDPAQIEQVLINILDNASKFTPRAGSISIKEYPFFWERRWTKAAAPGSLDRRRADAYVPNACRIDIRDSGPSIPPNQLPKIFEEYISFKGGQDRSGAGLGLAICKLIISRHQGRIWAESNGHGNLFSIVIPFAPSEYCDESLAS